MVFQYRVLSASIKASTMDAGGNIVNTGLVLKMLYLYTQVTIQAYQRAILLYSTGSII